MKMGNLRRGICTAIAISLLLSALNIVNVGAATKSKFVVKKGVLTEYNGKDKVVAIPGDLGITKIGDSTFDYNYTITTVTVPVGVKEIGYGAFEGCSNLTTVTLPEGITKLGAGSFAYCEKLKSINIPSTTAKICDYAFEECESLESIILPEGVKTLGDNVFEYCGSLTTISIPNSLKTIGRGVFNYTSISTPILIDGGKNICYIPDFYVDYTIPNTVTKINDYAFDSRDNLTSVTIPEGVVSIGKSAFRYCERIKSIKIPDSVTSVGDNAFYQTRISSVVLANKGKILCYVPKNTVSYSIPNTVTTIAGAAFDACWETLKSVTIPNGVVKIGNYAFDNCVQLKSIDIPNSVTYIGERAFNECVKLSSVKISANVISAGESPFSSIAYKKPIYINKGKTLCYVPGKVEKFSIPNTVTLINAGAFNGCWNLSNISIPKGVKTIGTYAFGSCYSLSTISISQGVTKIGDGAFSDCYDLKWVLVPSSVTTLGGYIFDYSYPVIYGDPNSKIRTYANKGNIRFKATPTFVLATSKDVISNNGYSKLNVTASVMSFSSWKSKTAYKDGVKYKFPSNGVFAAQGKYSISYKVGAKTVVSKFTIDKSAPKIIVYNSGGVPIGINIATKASATIKFTEKNLSTKMVKLNGKKIKWPANGKVKGKGNYTVIIEDKAGNRAVFTFRVF